MGTRISFFGEGKQIIDANMMYAATIVGPAGEPEGFLGQSPQRHLPQFFHTADLMPVHLKDGFECGSPLPEICDLGVELG
jgi:hypothetical protein